MKKMLFIALALVVCMTGTSGATDWSVVKSGGSFYVSSYSDATIFFYGKAGESYVLSNFSNSIKLACGISSASSGKIEASGYDVVSYSTKADDLYLAICIKSSGTSGDTIVGVLDASFFKTREATRHQEPTDEEKDELQKKMYETLGK